MRDAKGMVIRKVIEFFGSAALDSSWREGPFVRLRTLMCDDGQGLCAILLNGMRASLRTSSLLGRCKDDG